MRLAAGILLVASVAAADGSTAEPPRVVTQAWLHELNAAGWPLDKLVDHQRGLIVLERVIDTAGEDSRGVVSAKKYCGAELERELRVLSARLHDEYRTADSFQCHNKPSAGCSFNLAFEYTTINGLGFDKADDGTLRLTRVTFLDGGSLETSFFDEQARWVDAQLSKLAKVSCAGAGSSR